MDSTASRANYAALAGAPPAGAADFASRAFYEVGDPAKAAALLGPMLLDAQNSYAALHPSAKKPKSATQLGSGKFAARGCLRTARWRRREVYPWTGSDKTRF